MLPEPDFLAGGTTDTVTDRLVVPPSPLQSRTNSLSVYTASTASLPLTPRGPLQSPDAVQPSAPDELQVSVTPEPVVTEPALALSDTVGGSGTSLALPEYSE